MAALLILEPIFEADFLDCSYGFRPGRNAHQALGEIRRNLQQGRRRVYDADLSSYFDTIPHDKLMACVRKRVADRSVLHLIRLGLKAVVEEAGEGPDDPPKMEQINRMLRGWQEYFSQGYSGDAHRDVDSFTLRRRWTHLHRRSQRRYQKPKGMTWWDHLQRLGWIPLQERPVQP